MIIRPRLGLLISTAAASVALLVTLPTAVVAAAPVVVTDYKQLVGTIGSNNDFDTGERFARCVSVCPYSGVLHPISVL